MKPMSNQPQAGPDRRNMHPIIATDPSKDDESTYQGCSPRDQEEWLPLVSM